MDFVADLLIPGVAGVVGGFLGAALNVVWRVKVPVVLPAALGHDHDWHISGKRGGEVRMYCTGCSATKGQAD
jgi:hypothetical protein